MEPTVTNAHLVRRLLSEYFDCDPSALSDDVHLVDDLGADSLDLTEVLIAVEEEFEQNIPDEVAENTVTVGQIISYLSQNDAVSDAYTQCGAAVGATVVGRVVRISPEYKVSGANLRDIAMEVTPGSDICLACNGPNLEKWLDRIVNADVGEAVISRAFGRDRPLLSGINLRAARPSEPHLPVSHGVR